MIISKQRTDQRLIDMIRVKYAQQEGIDIGFNRFNFSDDAETIKDKLDPSNSYSNVKRKRDMTRYI